MAKKNTNTNTNDTMTDAELVRSGRPKKTTDRTDEEKAALSRDASQVRLRGQERMTSAITQAVALSSSILAASQLGGVVDRVEGLRNAMIEIETVRGNVHATIRNQAFAASVDVIIDQAQHMAQTSWELLMEEIRTLEAASAE